MQPLAGDTKAGQIFIPRAFTNIKFRGNVMELFCGKEALRELFDTIEIDKVPCEGRGQKSLPTFSPISGKRSATTFVPDPR